MPTGGPSTSQTSSTNYPSWLQKPMQSYVDNVTDMYQNAIDKPNQNPWMPHWSNQTNNALDALQQHSASNMRPNSSYQSYYQNIMDNGGFAPGQTAAMNYFKKMKNGNTWDARQYRNIAEAGGYNKAMRQARNDMFDTMKGADDVSTEKLNSLYDQFVNTQSFAEQNLGDYASGKMIGESNPHLQNVIDQMNRKAQDAAAVNAMGSGRYGSASHAKSVGDAISDQTSNFLANQYNQDVAHMMGANSQMDAGRFNRLNSAHGVATNIAGIDSGNANRRMGASQNLFNMGNTAMGNRMNALGQYGDLRQMGATNMANLGQQSMANMSTAYQQQQAPMNDLLQIGQMHDQFYQQQQMAPWMLSSNYANLFNSNPLVQNPSTTTTTSQNTPWWQSIAGPAMYTLGGMF